MTTPACRRLQRNGWRFAAVYFTIFFATFYLHVRFHPHGWALAVLALLPVLPVLGMFVAFGRYLRDERDEYTRELTIRFLLWGTAGCLAAVMLDGFLRIYGWQGALPPFTGFWAFWIFMMAAKLGNRVANPMPADE